MDSVTIGKLVTDFGIIPVMLGILVYGFWTILGRKDSQIESSNALFVDLLKSNISSMSKMESAIDKLTMVIDDHFKGKTQ